MSLKDKNFAKPVANKRLDRQNISPDSEYSGNSGNNKSIKSNTSKISIYKKMVSPTNKSTKSAKVSQSTPNMVEKNTAKKNIVETNLKK